MFKGKVNDRNVSGDVKEPVYMLDHKLLYLAVRLFEA